METTATNHKAILLDTRQSSVDPAVPIAIRTGTEAAVLLERGDQTLAKWLPLLCERVEVRNAPIVKGLSAKRLYSQSVQMLRYCDGIGVETWEDFTAEVMGDWLGAAWVDRNGKLQRPAKHRIDDRWKVSYALFHEGNALGAAVNLEALCKENVYVDSDILDRRPLTDEEAEMLKDEIDGTALATTRSVLFALGFSGGTPMESSLVQKYDIDLQAKTVRFKGANARTNPMDDWAARVVDLYLRANPKLADDTLLCVSRQRAPASSRGPDNVYVYQSLKTGLREMGFAGRIGITASSLYLTGARWVLESSGIVAAALFLGWVSLDTTARAIGYEWRPEKNSIQRRANSTGGCDISAMMAGQHATQPTGGGFQYGTAIVSRRARSDRGDGPGGARRGADRAVFGPAPLDGVPRARAQRRSGRLRRRGGAGWVLCPGGQAQASQAGR